MSKIVRTVDGDIQPEDLGLTLCHEHLATDVREGFGDADLILDNPEMVAEDLMEARLLGLEAVVDVTTTGMKPNPLSLLRIAELTELHIIAAAGFYHGHFLPAWVHQLSTDEMTETMVREVERGIDESGVRAGVIGEVGASVGEITATERRLFTASGRAQATTNAAVITHTDVGKMAPEILDILEAAGATPERVLMGHMDCTPNHADHLVIAKRGAFVGFDRIGLSKYVSDEVRIASIIALIEAGHADKVILSQDIARQTRLLAHGGKGYGYLLREFLPNLRQAGVDEATVQQIMVDNPRRLLAFEPRRH